MPPSTPPNPPSFLDRPPPSPTTPPTSTASTASPSTSPTSPPAITGLIHHIATPPASLSTADFLFAVGNTNAPPSWLPAPAPTDILSRPGAGVDGSTRITITFPDDLITNQWLRITLLGGQN